MIQKHYIGLPRLFGVFANRNTLCCFKIIKKKEMLQKMLLANGKWIENKMQKETKES